MLNKISPSQKTESTFSLIHITQIECIYAYDLRMENELFGKGLYASEGERKRDKNWYLRSV